MSVRAAQSKVAEGLKDGGHVYVRCSNCNAGLMDIWVTRPDETDPSTGKPWVWNVQANCPFCGDHSFVTTVVGGFHPGGFGIPAENDEDETVPSTVYVDSGVKNVSGEDIITFKIEKASPDAKPHRH